MASELPAAGPQREVVYESVESLRAQLKEIEDKWNDELKRLDTARKDKAELERILRVLQTFLEYERAATLKMEEMLKETRDALNIPDEAGDPATKTAYDPSRSAGSSSTGDSSVLEFDLVYNPYAAPKVLPKTLPVSSPSSLPSSSDQVARLPPLPTPTKSTPKPRRSPNWKSRITSILISTNGNNRTNPPSPLSNSLNSTTPLFDGADDAEFPGLKPSRSAKSPKRPPKDSEAHGTARWRRTIGSTGSKFANRANRDVSRKSPGTIR